MDQIEISYISSMEITDICITVTNPGSVESDKIGLPVVLQMCHVDLNRGLYLTVRT